MNGPDALLLAFGGGLVSFLSPCTLPLLPGYLAYISGLSAEEVQENRGAVLGATALFVLGFSLVFVALGATLSFVGAAVASHRDVLNRVAGVFIIIMALFMIGVLRFPVLYMERRFHVGRELGVWSALPLGMAFAFGWSPCIGPILGSIYTVALTQSSTQRGALLLFIYALGLGMPFLAVAIFTERAFRSLAPVKRHIMAINRLGGAVLLVMGLFLLMNRWTELLAPLLRWYANLNLPT